MHVYCGRRNPTEAGPGTVWKNGRVLNHANSLKWVRHSPDGFQWGYQGSGPAQLAFALLLDVLGSVKVARWWYQQFKREVVAALPCQFVLTTTDIQAWFNAAKPETEREDLRYEASKTENRDPRSPERENSDNGTVARGGASVLGLAEGETLQPDTGNDPV